MGCSQIWAKCKDTYKSNVTKHMVYLTSCRKKFEDFFVLDICALNLYFAQKPIAA